MFYNSRLKRERIFENRILGLLTIEEVAAELNKAPQTIRNWIAKQIIPHVRIGNKNMVRRESLEAWITKKETKSW